MNGQMTGGTSLSLPIQAAPVYRTTVGGAVTGSGVEASGWLEDIVDVVTKIPDVVKTVSQVAGPVMSGLSAFGI
jgi:hypothetical protein